MRVVFTSLFAASLLYDAAPATGANQLPSGSKALDSMRAMQRVIEDLAQRASF